MEQHDDRGEVEEPSNEDQRVEGEHAAAVLVLIVGAEPVELLSHLLARVQGEGVGKDARTAIPPAG